MKINKLISKKATSIASLAVLFIAASFISAVSALAENGIWTQTAPPQFKAMAIVYSPSFAGDNTIFIGANNLSTERR